jgi:hypothetical protein
MIEIETGASLPNWFFKGSITLMLKSNKNSTGKENYTSICFMNIDVMRHNKILATLTQQQTERIMHHNQVRFFFQVGKAFNIQKSMLLTTFRG